MSFFAVLVSLLIEQIKPLPRTNLVHDALSNWLDWAGRNFNAGRDHHAWVVWLITVLAPTLVVVLVSLALAQLSFLLALGWDILVLYLTLGFRQFSHFFTDIRDTLERGDEFSARQLLSQWRHIDASELPRGELLRHVIEYSLLAAHRHVFGVFFWFIVLSSLGLGPAGAVLYRLAEFASRYWARKSRLMGAPQHDRLMELSQQLFGWVDYLPARLTAFGFAVVGNFEEAINGWRRDATLWRQSSEGILLASASGALGVRLGGSASGAAFSELGGGDLSGVLEADGHTSGATPVLGHLRSVVGLVWRSVILWMLLLALLSVANLLG
jgi:adenosylcobinamide-phosphate synthase